jgi:hypothetical protein
MSYIPALARRFWAVMLAVSLLAAIPIGSMALAKAKAPPDLRSSQWSVLGKSKGSLKGVGKFSDVSPVSVFFGPLDFVDAQQQVIFTLPEGQFIVVSNLESVLMGTFSQSPKGALTFGVFTDSVEGVIEEIAEVNATDVNLDVQSVDILRLKASGKAKASKIGDVLSIKLTVKFAGTGTVNGEFGASTGSYSFSGKGTRVSL